MNKFPRNGAFALVLVMITIVLAATMAVFFLGSAGRERRGVDLYARSSHVRHLAGMTVNKVIGQIGEATKEGTASTPVSWTSQPGMVRTFAAGGGPSNVYKLYSWDNLKEAGSGFSPNASTQVPPADWKSTPAMFTDLNQPIHDIYPILDPRAEGHVQGFSINKSNPAVAGSGSDAPMPVKWLYVLEDGQMVAPTSGGATTVNVAGASASNPIVGRVAFWTDDDTSKVNVNTASEGIYWDVPRSGSRDDMQLAGNPPVKNEFHRVSGHPATTSLSAVFPELITESASDPTQTRWGGQFKTQMEALTKMTPRVSWGTTVAPLEGSQGGTYPVTSYSFNYPPPRDSIPLATIPRQITLDTDRLYASADDFWFRAPATSAEASRAAQPALEGQIDSAAFQRRLFFLTSNSRAPETTLFETPRISLWPITWPNASSYFPSRTAKSSSLTAPAPQDPNTTRLADINPSWITAEERLIAFCSTLDSTRADGGDRYFFQRKDPDSPVNDWSNITRNRDLVTYLRNLMSKQTPGFGQSLQSSLGSADTANWLALNTLNYVRTLINQYTVPNAQEGVRYSFTGVSFRKGRISGIDVGGGVGTDEPNAKIATPLRATIDGTEFSSSGNYPALEEVAVMFYAAKRNEPEPPALPGGGLTPSDSNYPEWRNPFNWQNLINLDSSNGYPVGTQTTVMRAVMILDFTGLEPGVGVKPTFWVKVRGASFQVNGAAIGLPNTAGLVAQCSMDSTSVYNVGMGPLFKDGVAKVFNNSESGSNVWQLVSDDIVVSPAALNFAFRGSQITVEIYACNPASVDVDPTNDPTRKIYEKVVNFNAWDGTLPMPMAPRWTTNSRSYRFNNDGSEVTGINGVMAGGTKAKADSNVPMSNFVRTSGDPLQPLWQPNPAFSTFSGTGVPDTSWAWSEYAPSVTNVKLPLVDVRTSSRALTVARNYASTATTYAYRGGIAGYERRETHDPDDARESGNLLRNISTNLRKRTSGLVQRNSSTRAVFTLEGHAAVAQSSAAKHIDQNLIPGGTADIFIFSTEAPLKESPTLLTPYDTVIGMVNAPLGGTAERDPRLAMLPTGSEFVRADLFSAGLTLPQVIDPALFPRTTVRSQWHQIGTPGVVPNITGYQTLPTYRNNPFARRAGSGEETTGLGVLYGMEGGGKNKIPDSGDWTGMPGRYNDGGLLTRPDQEYQQLNQDTSGAMMVPFFPRVIYGDYLNTGALALSDMSFFSPNRQVPSPILLGTLPRSMTTGWQSLAFSPNPADPSHPGLSSGGVGAPDHLYLDLFWMPVAEPYPISELFSTAGKVNLNYRIMPFSYIDRKTALVAAMKNTWITALTENVNNTANYKSHAGMRDQPGSRTRYAIDTTETLKGFDEIFNAGGVLRSASQVCEMYLVPRQTPALSLADTKSSFWITNRLTPDNAREEPYNSLYSRVTTKSNTYTVHWRVQALQKVPGTGAGVWEEGRDRMTSELRGATSVERYLDSNATDIPDYATSASALPLSHFYKWRVNSENYFQP